MFKAEGEGVKCKKETLSTFFLKKTTFMVEFGGAGVWVKYVLVDIRPSSQFSFFTQKNHFEGVHLLEV